MQRLEEIILKNLQDRSGEDCYWWEGSWRLSSELLELAAKNTESLRKAGFKRGYRIAALLPNSPQVLALSLAAWSLGGAIAPLNAKSGLPSLLGTLELIEPCAVVLAPGLDELKGALVERGVPVITAESLTAPLPEFSVVETSTEDDSLAVIFATSGTTGLPKAVPLSHGNLLDNALQMYEALELLAPGDVLLNVLPNFHSFGYTVSGLMPLVRNLKQTILASFLPPVESMKAIHASGTNVIVAVPAMLHFMIIAADKGAPAPRDLKMVVTGGDRLNVQLDAKSKAVLGAGVVEGYGLTECSPVVAVNNNYEKRRLGTVGPFIGGYEWRLRDDKNADVTASGEGVLWVRGPSVTDGYFRDPAMTAERFEDGWFNTGDYVRIEEGYVQILDRVTDIIIVG
ncbi:MAG: AMP-binding protein, partial [Synergistota bacterium]|nr:AMP-binding protein [Synergistota bacterium]